MYCDVISIVCLLPSIGINFPGLLLIFDRFEILIELSFLISLSLIFKVNFAIGSENFIYGKDRQITYIVYRDILQINFIERIRSRTTINYILESHDVAS